MSFTSMVIICYLCRYNHLMFADYREPLVEVASQLLVVLLDHDTGQASAAPDSPDIAGPSTQDLEVPGYFFSGFFHITDLCTCTMFMHNPDLYM